MLDTERRLQPCTNDIAVTGLPACMTLDACAAAKASQALHINPIHSVRRGELQQCIKMLDAFDQAADLEE